MSDDTNAQGTPPPSGPSWTPPPPTPTPTPLTPDYQAPPPDATGGAPTPARTGPTINVSAPLVYGVVAVIGIVLGLFLKESPVDGAPSVNLWDQLSELWSIVAILAAVLALLPLFSSAINLSADTAWRVQAGGAAALVLWWVLFVLPNINVNVSFLATVGVAAAVLAAWTNPDNPYKADAST